MELKASLVGVKMVTSPRELAVSARPAAVRAPARAVRLAATRVAASLRGKVNTRSMTWMVPPVKLTF